MGAGIPVSYDDSDDDAPDAGADYRPRFVQRARGFRPYGAADTPIGRPVLYQNPAPPTSWQGGWQPTEAEWARWGGAIVLDPALALAPAPVPGFARLFDATLPFPLAVFPVFNAWQPANLPGWQTPILIRITLGIGRANTTFTQQLSPTAPTINFGTLSARQLAVDCAWSANTLLGEPPISVFGGIGKVG